MTTLNAPPPHGPTVPRPEKRKRFGWLALGLTAAGALILGVLFGVAGGSDSTGTAALPAATVTAPAPTVTATKTVLESPTTAATTAKPTVKATPKPAPKPTKTTAKPTMTRAQEQAIGTAQDYLDTGHFSKKGLIQQLVYEDYSKKDAEFAVEHIKVSWKQQAAGAAKDYLDTGHFSRSGLIEQLMYEGYTRTQAEYGASEAGL
jgi:hypothetical protein